MPFWVALIISLAFYALSSLLTPKPSDAEPDQVEFPTNDETAPIKALWGTRKIDNPNILWAGDLKVLPIKKKVFNGLFFRKVITGYKYHYGAAFGLCYGASPESPAQIILRKIYVDDKVAWEGSLSSATNGVSVDLPNFFGGDADGEDKKPNERGGIKFTFDFAPGSTSQAQNAYLLDQEGATPSYAPEATVVIHGYSDGGSGYFGNSAQVPRIAFQMSRYPDNLDVSVFEVQIGADNLDANPAQTIYDILRNPDYGLGEAEADIEVDDFEYASVQFGQIGFGGVADSEGLSYLWTSTEPIENVLELFLRQTDTVLYTDLQTGKWRFKMARNDYTVAGLPHVTNDESVEIMSCTRGALSTTSTGVVVTYKSRAKGDKNATEVSPNFAAFDLQGDENVTRISYPACATEELAIKLAERDERALTIPLLRLTLAVDRMGGTFTPASVFKWSCDDPDFTADEVVMRVTKVRYGTLQDGRVVVEAIEDVFNIGAAVGSPATRYSTDPLSGADDALAAPNVLAIEAPYFFQGDDEQRIAGFAARPDDDHLNYDLMVSSEVRDSRNDFTPTGTLVNAYPATTADIDTSDTLVIEDITDLDAIEAAASDGELANGESLAYLNGEWVAFRTLTDNGDGTITLNNVWRGLLDSAPKDHAAGTRIWFASAAYSLDETPGSGGTAAFATRTLRDVQTEGEAATSAVTVARRAARPYPPSFLTIEGSYTATTIPATGDIDLTWLHRNRVTQITLQRQNTTGIIPELAVSYVLKIYNDAGTLIRTETDLDTSFTYTNAQETTDNGSLSDWLTFVLYSIRNDMTSFNAVMRQVSRPGAGAAPALPTFTPSGSYVPAGNNADGISGIPVDPSSTPTNGQVPTFDDDTGTIVWGTPGTIGPGDIDGLYEDILVDPTDLVILIDPENLSLVTDPTL